MLQKFDVFNALVAKGYNKITKIQSLWSDYGAIYRLQKDNGQSVVVKHINPPITQNHPRNWNTDISHQRKLKSYQVEYAWYKHYSMKCTAKCKVPSLLDFASHDSEQLLIMEDLGTVGYPTLLTSVDIETTKIILKWLANFHAQFIHTAPKFLWNIGTYWHLDTRPDEYAAMPMSPLKIHAHAIDNHLNNCKYKTLVHGDAKLANFCFSQDLKHVAAVDFQYVGGGCGMKDVAYLLGSCLNNNQLKTTEAELLAYYFQKLTEQLPSQFDTSPLIKEWTDLYPFAWADFERFLSGWAPGHQKLTSYSQKMTTKALNILPDFYSKNS